MKVLRFNESIAYVVASKQCDPLTKKLFRPIANVFGPAVNETVTIGEAFCTAPNNVTQSSYERQRNLLKRGVRILDCEIISRDGLSEEKQSRLLADLWTGKPVEGFP